MAVAGGQPGEVARRLTINASADLDSTVQKALESPDELRYDPAKDYSQRKHPYRPEEHGGAPRPGTAGAKADDAKAAGSKRPAAAAAAEAGGYDESDDDVAGYQQGGAKGGKVAKGGSAPAHVGGGDDLDDFEIDVEEEDLEGQAAGAQVRIVREDQSLNRFRFLFHALWKDASISTAPPLMCCRLALIAATVLAR